MIGAIVFCVAAETAREICFKYGAAAKLTAALMRPVIWFGLVVWAIELVTWTIVLGHVALSVAFPLMASSYASIALAGALIFKETINIHHALGLVLVTAGVICVGATGL
jgi:undecaprenyl phosphate-alpha-L-ara4N flippase subunit ArnE